MAQRVRLGVAGLGRMGRLHAENLAVARGVELVTVVDEDESRAGELAADLGCNWTRSYDELLGDPSLDGVVVVTPTALHVPMVEQAAAAGKHVFCEKPLAFDARDAAKAVAA